MSAADSMLYVSIGTNTVLKDLQFPCCGYVGVAPELVELLESRSAFLNSCCDVSIHQANVMLVCWVLCGSCDDGA